MSRSARTVILVIAMAVLAGGCVSPAFDTDAYEGKAALSAGDAASALESALLATETALDDRMWNGYLEVMVVDSEESFDSVQLTFDSVQPPDTAAADALRDELDRLLSDGSDGLATLRIAVRRQDTAQLVDLVRSLHRVGDQLGAFEAAHR
jgi:hypothetical protein